MCSVQSWALVNLIKQWHDCRIMWDGNKSSEISQTRATTYQNYILTAKTILTKQAQKLKRAWMSFRDAWKMRGENVATNVSFRIWHQCKVAWLRDYDCGLAIIETKSLTKHNLSDHLSTQEVYKRLSRRKALGQSEGVEQLIESFIRKYREMLSMLWM